MTDVADGQANNAGLLQVKNAGTKVIVYDTVSNTPSDTDGQVTTNVYLLGQEAADAMAKVTGGKGTFLIVDLAPGVSSTNERRLGFINEANKKYPGMKILPVQFDNLDASKDAQIMSATLARYPDLTGVFFTYDNSAVGGMPTIINAHKAGKIKVVSNDADPILVKYLKEGYIQALFPHNVPQFAKDVVQSTVNALQGKPNNPITTEVPPVEITSANVNDPTIMQSEYKSTC
jgi:ribose transport system substrate-binding protein